ncbi:CatB-related O-acetyltransferase [Sneathiella sp.]|uniref:CatB-related O-acetyltransferase n=1 Tax=Sneathiella sp. TaxID=1964365 RepID=UPI003566C7B1
MDNVFTLEKLELAQAKTRSSKCRFSRQIHSAYRVERLRRVCIALCSRCEGGRFFSQTLREILATYHDVKVGRYSYGPCLDVGEMPRGTTVGSYCSFGSELNIFRRNHPGSTLTQHPFFYNRYLGIVDEDTIPADEDNPLTIGNDVWIGSRTTILPGCKRIGDGAIIGANSVVSRDIEDFSINAGNPAKMIRKRFTPEIEDLVRKSNWWELSLPELMEAGDLLVSPLTLDELLPFTRKLETCTRDTVGS